MAQADRRERDRLITAVPVTQAGYRYLSTLWPALLQGGMGNLAVRDDVRRVLEALHRVATGGTVAGAGFEVTGGNPENLNNLLNQSLQELNQVNRALGIIAMDS